MSNGVPHQTSAGAGRAHCACRVPGHTPRLVVVTGGPGAGKTATLELAKHRFCRHVAVLPEAATMLFTGGFPRASTGEICMAAQRAIFRVQVELERASLVNDEIAVALCDRGTLDGLAYWPGSERAFFEQLETSLERELSRYAAVIHLRTPPADEYTHENAMRLETAARARALDDRIMRIWAEHPNRHVVESGRDFIEKMFRALTLIEATIPVCCRAAEKTTT
jgi:predicted ATPase